MKSDQIWDSTYREIVKFIEENKRRPSKKRKEDHAMFYWIKYNKKRLEQGILKPTRIKRFKALLEMADKYRRINQYAYTNYETQQSELLV